MKKTSFVLLLLILSLGCKKKATPFSTIEIERSVENIAGKALDFCKNTQMNEEFCLLIDYGIHSGKKRFFLYDFKKRKITHRFLVSHGCCNSVWGQDFTKENTGYSNVDNSHCSSIEKYKLGKRGFSNWGVNIKYLMHGLEATNDNALQRVIVFHSWEKVPNQEVFPNGTPEGWGCPAISNESFQMIDPLLKKATKPVLMWIYDSKSF